jgi:hypothetical protein
VIILVSQGLRVVDQDVLNGLILRKLMGVVTRGARIRVLRNLRTVALQVVQIVEISRKMVLLQNLRIMLGLRLNLQALEIIERFLPLMAVLKNPDWVTLPGRRCLRYR